MRLQPAHEKGYDDEYEGNDGQDDACGKQFNGAVTVFLVLQHAEQACAQAENDQSEQDRDCDFGKEHDIGIDWAGLDFTASA